MSWDTKTDYCGLAVDGKLQIKSATMNRSGQYLEKLGKNAAVIGRHIMTCCADDIAYSGLVAVFSAPVSLKTRDWITVTAKICLETHKLYGGRRGPVLYVTSYATAEPPAQEVATFY